MRTSARTISLLTCALLLTTIAGCGDGAANQAPLGRVTGVATIKGQAYPELMVIFQPKQGKAGIGITDAQGKYNAVYGDSSGAPVGTCTVSFQWAGTPPEGVKIPEGWGGDSETTVEIKAGSNEYSFDLTEG